jgi:hypothetical protein
MTLKIDEGNLKEGLLGLVVALVEVIEELLERQAIRRIESGRLDDSEVERLGEALFELDKALLRIKEDNDLEEAVRAVRDGLDDVADDLLERFIDPEQWIEESHCESAGEEPLKKPLNIDDNSA